MEQSISARCFLTLTEDEVWSQWNTDTFNKINVRSSTLWIVVVPAMCGRPLREHGSTMQLLSFSPISVLSPQNSMFLRETSQSSIFHSLAAELLVRRAQLQQ